jgi:hypothetical protein
MELSIPKWIDGSCKLLLMVLNRRGSPIVKIRLKKYLNKFQLLRILAIFQDLEVIFWRMVTVAGGP